MSDHFQGDWEPTQSRPTPAPSALLPSVLSRIARCAAGGCASLWVAPSSFPLWLFGGFVRALSDPPLSLPPFSVSPSRPARQTIRYRGIQVENGGKLFGDIQFATEEEAS